MLGRHRLAPRERRVLSLLAAAWLGVLTTYLMVIADEEGGTTMAALIAGVLAIRLAWGPFTASPTDGDDASASGQASADGDGEAKDLPASSSDEAPGP